MFDQDTGDIKLLDRVNLNRGLASIGGSYGGGEDQLATANVAYISRFKYLEMTMLETL